MQGIPVDDDFPAADAEKAAEVNDGGPHHAVTIHDHVDDAPSTPGESILPVNQIWAI